MSYEQLDEEQVEDLKLRARTERQRGNGDPTLAYKPSAIAEQWPCRRCGIAMVGVTREAIDSLETFNRQLARKGEPPIPRSKVVFCEACIGPARAEREARAADDARAVASLRRELFTLVDNDLRERAIAADLRKHGMSAHEVDELIREAARRRTTPSTNKTTRRNAL